MEQPMSEYYTYRIRLANRDRVQVEKLNPQKQSVGQPSGAFGYKNGRKTEIDQWLTQAKTNQLNDSQTVRELGEALFEALFEPALRQDFIGFYDQVVHKENKLLRVELDIDEQALPDVAALPWEFMRVPSSAHSGVLWLGTATRLILSRRRSQWFAPNPIQLAAGEKLRLGVVVSAPNNLGPVLYDETVQELEALVANQPDRFEMLPLVVNANPDSLDRLLAQEPHILHFIGHGRLHEHNGKLEGQLALTHPVLNDAEWIDAEFFGDLLNTHQPAIVLLHACEGAQLSSSEAFVDVAARVVQQNIPVVVAMQYEVTNWTAMRFASRFYEEVAKGSPVDQAAQNGRRAIALNTHYRGRDFATPVLFMRVEDGHLFARPGAAAQPAVVEPPPTQPVETIDRDSVTQTSVPLTRVALSLPRILAEMFSLAEIGEITRELGFDPDNLSGNKSSQAHALYDKCARRTILDRLVNAIAQRRPDVIGQLKANLYVFIQNAYMSQISAEELAQICQELKLDCQQLQLDAKGLTGYSANNYIRADRTRALQDHMVENGRYPELVAAVKKRMPNTDFSIFEM
jgi:hypothetical protein